MTSEKIYMKVKVNGIAFWLKDLSVDIDSLSTGGVLGDPGQDDGHTESSDHRRVCHSGPPSTSPPVNLATILFFTTS